MKAINEKARQTMIELVDRVTFGKSKVIDNSPGSFMSVTIEYLRPMANGALYSVAHYWELNGDLMRNPDMEFFCAYSEQGMQFFPVSFRQDAPYFEQQAIEYGPGGHITGFYPRIQQNLVDFANMWLANIAEQQKLDFGLAQTRSKEATITPQ